MATKTTFEEYMRQVNEAMSRAVGVTADDLEDYDYATAHEDGVKPSTCAKRALANAGWGKVMSL